MPPVEETTLRLLVIDDSVEAAEAIVSGLRNSGLAARPSRPEDADGLGELLSGPPADLALVALDSTRIPPEQVVAQISDSGKDLPVLLVVDSIDDAVARRAMELGVRGVVLRGDREQVASVVRDAFADRNARRALRRLESQLRETERRCDALIESSRDPIAYVHEGMHIRANEAYLEMFGFETFEDIEGMSLLDLVAPQHVDGFRQLLRDLSRGEAPPPRYEVEARTLEGESFPAVMEFTPATWEGESCLQLVLRRQEVDHGLAREVEELRHRDVVTGLLNRPTFLRSLEELVKDAAQGGSHAVLMVEPDHYARLLEEIGLDAADSLLAAFARRLETALGEGDLCGRLGEHQFGVLRRGSDYHATVQLAEKIRTCFADAVLEAGESTLNVTVSIGGVQVGEKIASLNEVLAKAQHSIQNASSVGGNRAQVFDPGAVDRAEEERIAAWVDRIRGALDADGFVLHYQPLIALHGQPGECYDTFLRLRDEDGALTQPMDFLPIAEEHGLLWEIDRWVVREAITRLGGLRLAGRQGTLMVRISDASLQDDSLVNLVREQLSRHGVDGRQLILQLAEPKVSTQLRAAQEFRVRLADMGVRMVLEQFGSGLNSVQLLGHFDADMVRIDRSFSEDLATSPDSQERLRGLASQAQALGKEVIVDSVGDASTMTALFSGGISYAQGDFLAAPGPEMDYDFG